MNKIDFDKVRDFVEENIGDFHTKRLIKLKKLKLGDILYRKNPYLFRAKNLLTPDDLVKALLDAYLSSQEETIFGDFLENLVIFANQKVYQGWKSGIEGIDLEFDNNSTRFIISIKSGPNWGNSSQIKKMKENFVKAGKTLRTGNSGLHIRAINGCCYGRDPNIDRGDYFKYCGQQFWEFISNDKNIYKKIIEPLGHRAKERDEEFNIKYAQIRTKFSSLFTNYFCKNDYSIDWESLLEFSSAVKSPDKNLLKELNKVDYCNCTSGCDTNRCICKKNGKTCDEACECVNCKNTDQQLI